MFYHGSNFIWIRIKNNEELAISQRKITEKTPEQCRCGEKILCLCYRMIIGYDNLVCEMSRVRFNEFAPFIEVVNKELVTNSNPLIHLFGEM